MKRAFSRSKSWLVGAFAFGVFISAAMFVLSDLAGKPHSFLTEDPLQTANMPFYTGMLTNLGVVLWAGAAFSCWLCAILLRKQRRLSLFLGVSGLLTGYLLVDDLFMFHDQFLRYWLHLPEKLIFAAYALIFAGYLVYFLKDILTDPYFPVLGAAFFCLGTSMIYDAFATYGDLQTFIEDSIKFAGISLWFTYFFSNSIRSVEKFLHVPVEERAAAAQSLRAILLEWNAANVIPLTGEADQDE